MTFSEKYGNSDVPHEEKYGRAVADIGLDKIKPMIPWSKEELTQAYMANRAFNSISIDKWDRIAGFSENHRTGMITRYGSPLMSYLREAGVDIYSYAELVCILKEAARQMVLGVA